MDAKLTYLITVSRAHVLPALMLLRTLRHQTSQPIVVVGNLNAPQAARIRATGATYVDEDEVDLSGRFPDIAWQSKFRDVGWYKQMLLRLSADRYLDCDHMVVLDSEVFFFDSWDEKRLYAADGRLKSLGWTPAERKPEWDYRMYRGAAYLLEGLDGLEGERSPSSYVESAGFRRHISGVVLFSTANLRHLWQRLEREIDLPDRIDRLFNHEPELAFSDHDLYGIAADLGVFDEVDPPAPVTELLGWYDRHPDPAFEPFAEDASWSMCQTYADHKRPLSYLRFMEQNAQRLEARLPAVPYWNAGDRPLLLDVPDGPGPVDYFATYRDQLDHTHRARYATMRGALDVLEQHRSGPVTIVEIGTNRDANVGGGHSTVKFGEYLARRGGTLHSVDILSEAVDFSRRAAADYLPWIRHHVEDSTHFLARFEGRIDLLYLDGLDSTPGHEEEAASKQLEEIHAAFDKLAPHAVVLLDDAALPLEGKTRLSTRWLTENGFDLTIDAYQRLLVRTGGAPQGGGAVATASRVARALRRRVTGWLSARLGRARG